MYILNHKSVWVPRVLCHTWGPELSIALGILHKPGVAGSMFSVGWFHDPYDPLLRSLALGSSDPLTSWDGQSSDMVKWPTRLLGWSIKRYPKIEEWEWDAPRGCEEAKASIWCTCEQLSTCRSNILMIITIHINSPIFMCHTFSRRSFWDVLTTHVLETVEVGQTSFRHRQRLSLNFGSSIDGNQRLVARGFDGGADTEDEWAIAWGFWMKKPRWQDHFMDGERMLVDPEHTYVL